MLPSFEFLIAEAGAPAWSNPIVLVVLGLIAAVLLVVALALAGIGLMFRLTMAYTEENDGKPQPGTRLARLRWGFMLASLLSGMVGVAALGSAFLAPSTSPFANFLLTAGLGLLAIILSAALFCIASFMVSQRKDTVKSAGSIEG